MEKEKLTYVDHNCLLAELSKGHGSVDSAPIKFNRAADAVNTASEDDDAVVVEGDIVR
jgi:hypothetical protein